MSTLHISAVRSANAASREEQEKLQKGKGMATIVAVAKAMFPYGISASLLVDESNDRRTDPLKQPETIRIRYAPEASGSTHLATPEQRGKDSQSQTTLDNLQSPPAHPPAKTLDQQIAEKNGELDKVMRSLGNLPQKDEARQDLVKKGAAILHEMAKLEKKKQSNL